MPNNISSQQSLSVWYTGLQGIFAALGMFFCCCTDLVKLVSQLTYIPCLQAKYYAMYMVNILVYRIFQCDGCCSQGCHRYPMHSAQFALKFHHHFFHHSLSSPIADEFKSQPALISLAVENSMQSVYMSMLYQNGVCRYNVYNPHRFA